MDDSLSYMDQSHNFSSQLQEALSIKAQKQGKSLSSALLDAHEFVESFYMDRRPKAFALTCIESTDTSVVNLCIEVRHKKENDTMEGKIFFYGKGLWKYDFTIKQVNRDSLYKKILESQDALEHFKDSISHLTYSFDGEGSRWKHPQNDDICNHIFSLASELDDFLTLKENFTKNIGKKFSMGHGLRDWRDKISHGWSTSYYDGPLAGFCYINHTLFHFHHVEELDFSQARLYHVYPLSKTDKLRAYFSHYFWQKKWYRLFKKVFKLDKKYNTVPAIGHFNY